MLPNQLGSLANTKGFSKGDGEMAALEGMIGDMLVSPRFEHEPLIMYCRVYLSVF